MTSVAVSGVLVIVAIALLIILCMKGLNIIPVALLCTLIVSLSLEGGVPAGLYGFFAEGFGGFAGGLVAPFMTGGAFGAMMMATGADVKFGKTLIKAFGEKSAVIILAIFVGVLSYCNIPSFPFLGAILAFSLMRAINMPRNVACVTMVGAASAFQFLLPGSPSIVNLVPGGILGTNLYAGAGIGVVMAVVQLVIVFLYVYKGMMVHYRKVGMGYTPTPMEETLKGQQDEIPDDQLPSFFVSILPLIVVVGTCVVFQLVLMQNPYLSCVYAQLIGIVLIILMNLKRGILGKLFKTISNGCLNSAVPLVQTCSVVGFASVVTATSAYNAVLGAVDKMNMNPYVLVVIGTAVLAAIAADPISGMTLSTPITGVRAVASGANPGLVHRLICAASTTFDSMPHSGNLNVTMNFLGLSHKEVYGQIVVVQIVATSCATIVGMVIAMIIG